MSGVGPLSGTKRLLKQSEIDYFKELPEELQNKIFGLVTNFDTLAKRVPYTRLGETSYLERLL